MLNDGTTQRTSVPACALVRETDRVERAVDRIRTILAATIQGCIETIGAYLLDEFYEGNPALYTSTHPRKHVSLRMLLARCQSLELPVTQTLLSESIRTAALLRQLPEGCKFAQLPASHRSALLVLKSPARIEHIAGKALSEQLTVRQVRKRVREEAARTKSSRGRKPIPEVIRAVSSSVRTFRDGVTGRLPFLREDIDALTAEQLELLRADTKALLRRLTDLDRLLERDVRCRGVSACRS